MSGRTARNKNKDSITMLSTIKDLKSYRLETLDGEIGKAKEFYFDDRHWSGFRRRPEFGHEQRRAAEHFFAL